LVFLLLVHFLHIWGVFQLLIIFAIGLIGDLVVFLLFVFISLGGICGRVISFRSYTTRPLNLHVIPILDQTADVLHVFRVLFLYKPGGFFALGLLLLQLDHFIDVLLHEHGGAGLSHQSGIFIPTEARGLRLVFEHISRCGWLQLTPEWGCLASILLFLEFLLPTLDVIKHGLMSLVFFSTFFLQPLLPF
jgi:hypothetical protein